MTDKKETKTDKAEPRPAPELPTVFDQRKAVKESPDIPRTETPPNVQKPTKAEAKENAADVQEDKLEDAYDEADLVEVGVEPGVVDVDRDEYAHQLQAATQKGAEDAVPEPTQPAVRTSWDEQHDVKHLEKIADESQAKQDKEHALKVVQDENFLAGSL